MKLLPIGTKIYSFLTHPFRFTEGEIIGYTDTLHRYKCRFHDPHLNQFFEETNYWVYTTKEEAKEAHDRIQKSLDLHTKFL
jgi:hypothetical protein